MDKGHGASSTSTPLTLRNNIEAKGVSLGVSFVQQTPLLMLLRTGIDARFAETSRQIVLSGGCVVLLWEQEVPGSNPGAPTG